MKQDTTVIWLHTDAPPKPVKGQRCNGCGVCCAAEPCPVARVFLWQWRGACQALLWTEATQQYRCGLMMQGANYLPYLPSRWQGQFNRLIARWIAADTACDSSAQFVIESVSDSAH
ncbi:hypothetical protein BH11PSE12_BH11PSE12_05520 [soil metagenome]